MVRIISLVLLLVTALTCTTASAVNFTGDNFDFASLENAPKSLEVGGRTISLNKYYHYAELGNLLDRLSQDYGNIVRKISLGRSARDKRELWAVQISGKVMLPKGLKPSFKFVANVHGDDAVGYAMMVSLIQYLVYSYGVNDTITDIVDNIDIWIVPSLNPDGFKRSELGRCDSLRDFTGKFNGRNEDLDQDYYPVTRTVNGVHRLRQDETYNMIGLSAAIPFVLSANIQGGAIVASYPWDNSDHSSLTQDDDVFKKLAKEYAERNPMMAQGNACNLSFPGGITNGNNWREKKCSMQDFNYLYFNCLEITLYVGCCKYPEPNYLPYYWAANLESMLQFIKSTRLGVYGLVWNAEGEPIKKAQIVVEGKEDKEIWVTEKGEYWRMLLPGVYKITAKAIGYKSKTKTVDTTAYPHYARCSFDLSRAPKIESLKMSKYVAEAYRPHIKEDFYPYYSHSFETIKEYLPSSAL